MSKRFNEFIEHKKETGVLYQHTFAGNDICGKCIYRMPWQDFCRKFKKSIRRVNQINKGFHHLPCKECLAYGIQKEDLQYYINSYKKKYPNRIVDEVKW